MGRGDRKPIRWAHDRERKRKAREAAQATERATERRAASKKRT